MKVRGATDGRLVIASLTGIYYALEGGRITPLLGLQSVSFSVFDRMPTGGFRHRVAEAEYYTDLASGNIVYRWSNPLTGESLDLADRGRTVSEFEIHPDLSVTLANEARFQQRVTASRREGDELWYEEQSAFTPKLGDGALASSECVTYHARLSDLSSARSGSVRADVAYVVLSGWRPWMKMGDRPGSIMLRGFGNTKIAASQLPQQWVTRTRDYWPDLLRSPETVLRK